MEKEHIINHLKDLINYTEIDIESYKRYDMSNMTLYKKGVKDGLDVAINWIESQ